MTADKCQTQNDQPKKRGPKPGKHGFKSSNTLAVRLSVDVDEFIRSQPDGASAAIEETFRSLTEFKTWMAKKKV